jgi:hypothetical protein
MRGQEDALSQLTPRVAAATLLMIDRVLEEYEHEKGISVPPVDRQIICDVLRAIACRDSHAMRM